MSTARPHRAELSVRDSIACIVTLRGREATAEVIDYRGVGPSKYDCEDALYEARRWVRRNVRDADPTALFAPAWAQGEVAVFTLALGRCMGEGSTEAIPRRVMG